MPKIKGGVFLKVSNFSRTVDNFANKGQYFTCPLHSKAIGKLLRFPDGPVSILEPSIGDGSALKAFLNGRQASVFGVELDNGIYNAHVEKGEFDYLLNADFLSGITVSNNAFSLVFANPPYGDSEYKERYESLFMKRIYNYLKPMGLMVLIIPYYLFEKDKSFARKFSKRFELQAVYKFHEREFQKYKQIVLIGRKRSKPSDENDLEANCLNEKVLDIENLDLLPMDGNDNTIAVNTSSPDSITTFQSYNINEKELETVVRSSGLIEKLNLIGRIQTEKNLSPPIPPKVGHLYLLGTTGFTSGCIGSEENGTLHLQRGKVTSKEIITTECSDENMKVLERKKTIRTTSMVIIDANGKIMRF